MSEADPMSPSDGNQAMILGEMRGQLREVVHGLNNLSMKFDGLTREVVALGTLAPLVGKLEAQIEAQDIRIKTLETQQEAVSTTASNFKAVVNSPVLGWLFLAAVAIYVALKGASL